MKHDKSVESFHSNLFDQKDFQQILYNLNKQPIDDTSQDIHKQFRI